MEHKIGETIQYEGTTLKVVEDLSMSCENCFFYKIGKCDSISMTIPKDIGECDAYSRNDRTYIIYEKA